MRDNIELNKEPDEDVLDSNKLYSAKIHNQVTVSINLTKSSLLDIIDKVYDKFVKSTKVE